MSDEPLRDRIARKLTEWAFQAAETKGVKLTSFHRHVIEQEAPERADMVMEVVRPELERLRAERDEARAALATRPKSRLGEQVNRLSNAVGDLERERDNALAEVERLRAELEDARRFLDQRRNDVFMWQQSYNHLAARALRFRLAWQSARRGRSIVRGWYEGEVAASERLHAQLQKYMDDKNTASAHFTNMYSRMHLEHDRLTKQANAVRALHQPVCGGACGLDDACECADRDLVCAECNDRCPCPTIRALDGTEKTHGK